MDGIFIINKEKGSTSHDIVSNMRKIFNTKKVGHAGTLDPMATGVLPILIGKATKIEKYLVEHSKKYIAEIKLGEKRDTGDSEGKVVKTADVDISALNKENIEMVLKNFLGKQKQIPPMYSAIKINGKKLYEYAREGVEIKLEPRNIEIYDIKLISICESEKTISFKVSCSKGTYIRALCEDIAVKLNTVGYMKELKRILVGEFKIENAMYIRDLEGKSNVFLESKLIPIEDIFKNKDEIILKNDKLKHFLNGVKITQNQSDGIYRIYNEENIFIGIGIIKNNLLKRDIII